MKNYVLEFSGSGGLSEGAFGSDAAAISWAESVLERHGYDLDEVVSGDWDADGMDGEERMLFWANEEDAANDPGVKSICALCVQR